ncbi:MAG: matrixin family metalloprotease [Pseudomonadota bacterium]
MSYELSGYKWGAPFVGTESGTVYWSIESLDGLTYNTSLYDDEDFEQATQDAFQTWEDISGIDFEMTNNASQTDISIDMTPLSGDTVGRAYISYRDYAQIDQIISADIEMDSTEDWAPYGETDLDFYAVMLHEIGHALGLDHVNDESQIMNPYVSSDRLGDGDIDGAQELYGLATGTGGSGGGGASPLPPSDDDTPEDDTPPAAEDEDDGGGGGGAIVALLGALVAILASVFGMAGGAAVAMLAGRSNDDSQEDVAEDGGEILTDVHELYVDEDAYLANHAHDHGTCLCGNDACDGDHSHDHDMSTTVDGMPAVMVAEAQILDEDDLYDDSEDMVFTC